jgi:hypothetical protein
MTRTHIARRSAALAASASLAAFAACGGGGNTPKYANDADTGAAAPATQQTLSPNPSMGDSTVGMSRGTGVGNMAGDTAGAFGKAAGTRQPAPGVPASGPAGSGMENKGTGAPQADAPARPKPLPATPH